MTTLHTASLDVSYGQIAVFGHTVEAPFSDWTDGHVAQGFAWRPGSASFATLEEAGPHGVTVDVTAHLGPVSPDAVRVIDVPFDVHEGEAVEIGSISDSMLVTVPAGTYLLRCELQPADADGSGYVRLTFASEDAATFRIVVADAALSPSDPLLTTAEPVGP